jgi:hypothetical protein
MQSQPYAPDFTKTSSIGGDMGRDRLAMRSSRSLGGDEPRSSATVGGGGDSFPIQAVAKFDIERFGYQPNCTDIQLHRLSSG